jgi:GTPase SAR1 family protein
MSSKDLVKIIVLGNSNVGKSSLIERYCTQSDVDLNAHVLDKACLSLLMGQVRLREIHG